MSWKCFVKAYGENEYNTNGLAFETQQEAEAYGNELLSRWYAAETFKTVEVKELPVNYIFDYEIGKAVPVKIT